MKLIALVDIYNSKALKVVPNKDAHKAAGFKHKDIIHRGARFEIGSEKLFKDLERDEQEVVGGLVSRQQVIFDNEENKALIEVLDEKIAKERAAQESKDSAAKPLSQSEEVAAAVVNALVAAGVIKLPAADKK